MSAEASHAEARTRDSSARPVSAEPAIGVRNADRDAGGSGQAPRLTMLAGAMSQSPHIRQLRLCADHIGRSPHLLQLKGYAGRIGNEPRPAAQSHAASAVVQRVEWEDVRNSADIVIEREGPDYVARFRGQRAGELELYTDRDGREWINNIRVYAQFQGRGIGLRLLHAAVEDHGAVYAAVDMTQDDEENDDDTRHLSTEGVALVNSALRNGVLQEAWCFNPAEEREMQLEGHGSDEEHEQDWFAAEGSDNEQMHGEQSDHEQGEQGEHLEADCTATVVLDDSNTGGMGYHYWVELTNTEDNQTIMVEFDDIVEGEEEFTTAGLEARLSHQLSEQLSREQSRALTATIRLVSWEVDYAD